MLTWSSTNATSCTGDAGTTTSGTKTVSPTVTTTYSETCGGVSAQATVTVAPASANSVFSIKVSGGHFVDQTGATVQLRGADRSGGEYACFYGANVFDPGSPMGAAQITAAKSWGANTFRVPMNETCWNSGNGNGITAAAYQAQFTAFVNLVTQSGMYAIIDLHWSTAGTGVAGAQDIMPDQNHATAFWTSVANTFKGNPAVIFDLYNEPYPDSNSDSATAWSIWKNGCSGCLTDGGDGVGMPALLAAVRATGATNVVMLGGVNFSSSIDQWVANAPTDPAKNLAASWHAYPDSSDVDMGCAVPPCLTTQMAAAKAIIAAGYPVVMGEFGDHYGSSSFVSVLLPQAEAAGMSYTAWTWNVWGANDNVLISDESGTPNSAYGQYVKTHLQCRAAREHELPVRAIAVSRFTH